MSVGLLQAPHDAKACYDAPARSGRNDAQVLDELADTIAQWMSSLLDPGWKQARFARRDRPRRLRGPRSARCK